MEGKVIAVCLSEKKGTSKKNVGKGEIKENFGIIGDAHAGDKERQVSLLAKESIDKVVKRGIDIKPGDFAENITTEGIDLLKLNIRDKVFIGDKIILEVTKIGKECVSPCAIYHTLGECIMPREGIFTKVISGGIVKIEDRVVIK
ncbi:MAG: MOSC domain-containing protein [Candidatus Firestonebacteria bacterium]